MQKQYLLYREDPSWKKDTFTKAANELGLKPIQAYKWGYHKKIKVAESGGKNELDEVSAKRHHLVQTIKLYYKSIFSLRYLD